MLFLLLPLLILDFFLGIFCPYIALRFIACFVPLETADRFADHFWCPAIKNAPEALESRFVWIIPAISVNVKSSASISCQ